MADGGWKYVGYITNPHGGSDAEHVAVLTAWKDYLVVNLSSEGWSQHAAVTTYGTQRFWFALEHTGGARLVIAYGGDVSSGTVIEASNEQDNTTRDVSLYENTFWVAYIQPHLSATALTGSPATSGFLPSSSLKFTSMWGYGELSGNPWGEPFGLHIGVRGGNVWFALSGNADNDPAINTLCLMGAFFDRLAHANHATEPDNHIDSLYGMAAWSDCNYTGTVRVQFFDAAQNRRTTSSLTYLSSLLTDNVSDREPWTWQSPTVFISSNDLENNGVVTGNGIKGRISPEWFRYTMFPGGPANDKQRINDGDFLYLRNGVVIGWDPSNGAML